MSPDIGTGTSPAQGLQVVRERCSEPLKVVEPASLRFLSCLAPDCCMTFESVTSLLWAQVSLLWELSRSFQPRSLGSSHLFLMETFKRVSAVAQLEENVPTPMLRVCGLPGKVLRVGEGGPSFCLAGTDPSFLPFRVAAAEALGLWLERHHSEPSEVPAFHGGGKGFTARGRLLTRALQGVLTVTHPKCTHGAVSHKASLPLGFQPLEETFSAVSPLFPPNDSWSKLNKIMELIRRRTWL